MNDAHSRADAAGGGSARGSSEGGASAAAHSSADDPRIGDLLGRSLTPRDAPAMVLVGFPSDAGVRRNGGRPGAADAPAAVRERLFRLTPDAQTGEAFLALLGATADLGDIQTTDDVEIDQRHLAAVLTPHLARGSFVVVIGGGHETAFGHFLAYAGREAGREAEGGKSSGRVAILNWDAHPDVRAPRPEGGHSGSPFRQALEHASRACARYTVAGLLRHSTARAHLDFVRGSGGDYVWRDALSAPVVQQVYDTATVPGAALMVSFDVDAVDRAHAPGVSAPATGGLDVTTWLHAAYLAGRSAAVRSVDVVEVNPRFDRDGQTVALAALSIWWVFKGLAERGWTSASPR